MSSRQTRTPISLCAVAKALRMPQHADTRPRDIIAQLPFTCLPIRGLLSVQQPSLHLYLGRRDIPTTCYYPVPTTTTASA